MPILLGGLLKSIGNPEPMRAAPPAKAYMNLLDAQRWAEHRGVPIHPRHRPYDPHVAERYAEKKTVRRMR